MSEDNEMETLQTTADEAEQTEVVEETTADVETEDTAQLKEQLAKKDELNKKLFERAKRAESEAKALKAKATEIKPTNTQIPNEELQEIRLIATKGLDEEDIQQVRILAKGKGVTLLEAVTDPMFDLYQKDKKERIRKEKAKLGASKGSGPGGSEKNPSQMTDAEFKEFWAKKMGR